MPYSLTLYEADVPPEERRAAEARFRKVLEETLGDAELVAPVYAAYLRIVGAYGEAPPPDTLTADIQRWFDSPRFERITRLYGAQRIAAAVLAALWSLHCRAGCGPRSDGRRAWRRSFSISPQIRSDGRSSRGIVRHSVSVAGSSANSL